MLEAIAIVWLINCADRDHLSAWLKQDHGLRLHSWGLSDEGNMLELFLDDKGHFAVIETKPSACSWIVVFPHKDKGRLWNPPKPNKAMPDDKKYYQGTPL